MKKRGIRSPWDLTEFDMEWVNPATRKDIQEVSEKHEGKVFGLKFWDWTILRGKELLDCYNFGVSLIFKDEDEAKVKKIIEDYEAEKNKKWSTGIDRKIVDTLHDLAVDSCTWV